jgi:polyphosphate kinase 2
MPKQKDEAYFKDLRELQIELVKLQSQLIRDGNRVLVIFEGRDAAGKDGAIKALTEHMAPRETRVFAPGKPTERENEEWYFQRFVPQLPANGEFIIFNRSWYNRAGVERVMGFASEDEVENFFATVGDFEALLVRSAIEVRKYYLDISRDEQKKRLTDRTKDPLKSWKISPIDQAAIKKWSAYTKARDEMFERTSHEAAPWHVVRADHKRRGRLALIADLLDSFSYEGKRSRRLRPDRDLVYQWTPDAAKAGLLAG